MDAEGTAKMAVWRMWICFVLCLVVVVLVLVPRFCLLLFFYFSSQRFSVDTEREGFDPVVGFPPCAFHFSSPGTVWGML